MSAKILIVEDEPEFAELLEFNLSAEGYETRVAPDGEAALEVWRAWNPDLVILDVMLPRRSGYDVCRQARLEGQRTSVLFLSAKGAAPDRIEGLEAGGDDYLSKPVHLRELLLRVAAMLRRNAWLGAPLETGRVYEFGGHRVDFQSWTVTLADGRTETLGEREMTLLKLFIEEHDRVISRDEILDRVWGADQYPSTRTVDNFMVRLRKLFEPDPARPRYWHTVWGVGYKFTPAGS
jgi:two-component system, OmpR family, alkaline phosphatase synthesis response regulator PhoP